MSVNEKQTWLIESGPKSAPIYLGFINEHPYWTFDLSKVAHFDSEENAKNLLDALVKKSPFIEYRIAEHLIEST